MANQIGNDHIRKFWDPRMRKQILAELDTAALDPRVRRAVEQLNDPA
jgi:formate dehydrogenase subunit delta